MRLPLFPKILPKCYPAKVWVVAFLMLLCHSSDLVSSFFIPNHLKTCVTYHAQIAAITEHNCMSLFF